MFFGFPKSTIPQFPQTIHFHFWERFWENGRMFPDGRICRYEEKELQGTM